MKATSETSYTSHTDVAERKIATMVRNWFADYIKKRDDTGILNATPFSQIPSDALDPNHSVCTEIQSRNYAV